MHKSIFPHSRLLPAATLYSPSQSSRLHLIRERHVIAPYIELPLSQAEDSAQNVATVHAYPHVDVAARCFPHNPVWRGE
jgi:hypothetical protein